MTDRLGIDFGGAKIEVALLSPSGDYLLRHRTPNPGAYDKAISTVVELVDYVEAQNRYIDRLGRALAVVCNLLDPDVIVLGGGMSNTVELYNALPAVVTANVFSDFFATPIRQASHGDSSGVRGAAWLWPE